MDCNYLRKEYPETVSMEQFYQICHISKRKARWLLETGVIPCEDSGKQTRRFQIQLEDVIDYLNRRGMAPPAQVNSAALASLLLENWADEPDMLTVKQAEALCGYGSTTLNRWVLCGHVAGIFCHNANRIAKKSLAEYLASPAGQSIAVKSNAHSLAMETAGNKQNSGMEFGSMSL